MYPILQILFGYLFKGDKCFFAGKGYSVGIDIPVNNSCIKCRCNVPPGPTCIRQSCPSNPENCPSTYKDNECCPIYNCVVEEEDIDSTTENIYGKSIKRLNINFMC